VLNLDVRDLYFWAREAQKKHLRDRMAMAQSSRVAMNKDANYERYMNDLKHELDILERGKENVFKESWQVLKEMRRG
jgi:hypothetical protein